MSDSRTRPLPRFVVTSPALAPADVNARDWRLLKVWSTTCAPCRDDVPRLTALAQELAEGVFVIDFEDTPAVLDAYKTVHGTTGIAGVETTDPPFRKAIGPAPVTLLVTPDNRYVILDEADWEPEARYWLSFRRSAERQKK